MGSPSVTEQIEGLELYKRDLEEQLKELEKEIERLKEEAQRKGGGGGE
jgi:prefoldin subunit 5